MKRGTIEHPKMLDFAGHIQRAFAGAGLAIGIDTAHSQACGIVERLFHFAARYAPAGDIGKHSDEMIARALGWDFDAAQLVRALCETKWVDAMDGARLYVHDWHDHSDDSADKWLYENHLTYANGHRTRRKKGPRKSRNKSRQVVTSRDKSRQSSSSSESSSESEPVSSSGPVSEPSSEPKPPANGRASRPKPSADAVAAVVAHYEDRFPRRRVGEPERKLIAARLREGFTADELTLAIDGCMADPWHQGENDRNKKFDQPRHVFKDASKVNGFIDIARDGPEPVQSEGTMRTERARQEVVKQVERFFGEGDDGDEHEAEGDGSG